MCDSYHTSRIFNYYFFCRVHNSINVPLPVTQYSLQCQRLQVKHNTLKKEKTRKYIKIIMVLHKYFPIHAHKDISSSTISAVSVI